MEKIKNFVYKFMSVCATIAGLMVFTGIFIVVINGFGRKFFGFTILWSDEVVTYLAVLAAFLGTPYILMRDGELSVGVITAVIKNKEIVKWMRFVFALAEIAIFTLLFIYCIDLIKALSRSGIRLNSLRSIPKYTLYCFLEVTFALDIVALVSTLIFNKGGFYHD